MTKIKNNEHQEGIKFNSIFNNLKHFHVCSPGLPPCLGHDLFEGVVAYDLKLFIEYFIEIKWFTLKELNSLIENFDYSIEDKKDKPVKVLKDSKKITGGACQIWNLLNLLPLILKNKVKDASNEVWACLLHLIEITEIICATKIKKTYCLILIFASLVILQ